MYIRSITLYVCNFHARREKYVVRMPGVTVTVEARSPIEAAQMAMQTAGKKGGEDDAQT